MRRLALLCALAACDPNLGPPRPLEDAYCVDVCARELFGYPDLNTCADWCEEEPTFTQEHLNCLRPDGLNEQALAGRVRGCLLLLGPIEGAWPGG